MSKSGAPCAYIGYDEVLKKNRPFYPAVACNGACYQCGWNPEVKEKRVRKMQEEIAARKKVQ